MLNIDRVFQIMNRQNMSIAQLAKKMGKSYCHVWKVLNEGLDVKISTAEAIANALGVSIHEVIVDGYNYE